MKKGNKKTRQSKEEKHKKVLTKNNFIQGAFISTLGIVVSKILGIVYVIPFHAIVKEQGGALYGYAYTIYSLFLALSSAGIPLAISKIISEYQTLGYYNAKERAFKIGKQLNFLRVSPDKLERRRSFVRGRGTATALFSKNANLWLTRAKNCGIIIDVAGNARRATMDLRP